MDGARACTSLCRAERSVLADAAREAANVRLAIACAQEAATFDDVIATMEFGDGAEAAPPELRLIDLRDRAFWSDATPEEIAPKIAALLAEGALQPPRRRRER